MKRSTKIAAGVTIIVAAMAAAIARFVGATNDVPARREPIPDPRLEAGVDGAAFLEHLAAAIRIDTTVHEDRARNDVAAMRTLHRFLAATYPAVHETCPPEVVNDRSLLFTWPGTDPQMPPIVLMAHMDVVPVEPGTEDAWTEEPFAGVIADGHVWGRGALDDKGRLIAMLEALEHLIATGFQPTRTIHLALGHDEEIGGAEGGKAVAEVLRSRGVRPWFVLDEGGAVRDSIAPLVDDPVALIKTAEKGTVSVLLRARDEGGHSSVPPFSTAVGRVSGAVRELEQSRMPADVAAVEGLLAALAPRLDPRLQLVVTNLRFTGPAVARVLGRTPETDALIRTTTAATMIRGGVKVNVLPQEATAVVNFRILPGDTVADVVEHVRTVVGDQIEVDVYGDHVAEPSEMSSTSGEAWDAVSGAVADVFPEAIIAPWTLTALTDSRHYADIADDIYGFGPFRIGADNNGLHATDERIRIADADRAVSFYVNLVRRTAG